MILALGFLQASITDMNTRISHRYKTHIILLQPQARERSAKEGFELSISKTSFKANTKALAENEAEGLAKVIIFSFHLW